ncbi:P-type conjugative transfer protein TrbJ, partial [Acinetobacter baumannii]
MNRFRHLAAVSVIALAELASVKPASAQLIVFDPNNYAQNVLTAARTLQQINNQIVSLQNQAQMLVNQARNLASLPYSSLQQLEQSIQRTQ